MQVVKDTATEQFLAMRRKDQQRALQHLRENPGLRWDTLLLVQHDRLQLAPMHHRLCLGPDDGCTVCEHRQLDIIQAPLFDLEVRGVPALQYFGSKVWNTMPEEHPEH